MCCATEAGRGLLRDALGSQTLQETKTPPDRRNQFTLWHLNSEVVGLGSGQGSAYDSHMTLVKSLTLSPFPSL